MAKKDKDKLIAEGDKLFQKGKVDAAIKQWEDALTEAPKDVNLLNKIGDAYSKISKVEDATKYYLKVGDHFAADGFFLKAIAMFKKINKNEPSRLDVYERLAELYHKQGLAMEAKSQYQVLADYHIKQGQMNEAIGVYLKIAGIDPNNINVHVKLADLFVQAKRPDEALKRYDQIGRMLLGKGHLDEAAQVYQKALKLQPGAPEALEALASILQQKNDPAAALGILEQASAAAPENPRILLLLGKTYAQLGRNSDAERALAGAAGASPDDTEIQETRASIALKRGDTEGAFRILKSLADNFSKKGEPKQAVAVLAPILKIDAHHVATLEAYLEYYQRAGEETTVLNHRNLLAEAFIAQQQYDRAAAVLSDLIKIEPENIQHQEKLNFVRQKMGIGVPAAAKPDPPPPPAAKPAAPPAAKFPAPPAIPPKLTPPAPPMDFEETGSFLSKIDGGVVEEPEIEVDLGERESQSIEISSMSIPEDLPEVEIDMGGGSEFGATAEAGEAISLGGDRDFIAEHMTEAEVFSKYGLVGKAIEHYQLVLSRDPGHKIAMARLLDLYIEEGQKLKVSELALSLAQCLRDAGDQEGLAELEERLTRGGFTLPAEAPARPVAAPAPRGSTMFVTPKPAAPPPPAAPAPEPAAEEEFEISLDAGEEPLADLGQEIEISFDEPEVVLEESHAAGVDSNLVTPAMLEDADTIPGVRPPPAEEELFEEAADFEVVEEAPEEIEFLGEEPGESTTVSPPRSHPLPQAKNLPPPPIATPMVIPPRLPEAAPAASVVPTPAPAKGPSKPSAKLPNLDELIGGKKVAKAKAPAPAAATPEKITESFLRDLGMAAAPKKKKHEEPAAPPPSPTAPPPPPEAESPFLIGVDTAAGSFEGIDSEISLEAGTGQAVEGPPVEEIGEIDFYIDQGLMEEARALISRLEQKFPGHPDLTSRSARLGEVTVVSKRMTGPVQVPQIPTEESGDFSMDLDLGKAIEEEMARLDADADSAEPAAPSASIPVDEGNLFADEDNFFDLASELEQEFVEEKPAGSPDAPAQSEEASLEQIFKEFKKGVEQQLDSEDYDTHYNLGIAYKEMGLVDEAIGEFQISSKDPKRTIECCSMLGLCFLEKGMPQLAIKWYRKGLENPDIREEENLGLLYDLANVYQESGDLDNAHKTLIEVYGINTNYRDVVYRIKELEEAKKQ